MTSPAVDGWQPVLGREVHNGTDNMIAQPQLNEFYDTVERLRRLDHSTLPVVSGSDPNTVVGSVGERGLLKRAIDNPGLMGAEIVDVMEPPFPAVATTDPVREAVELLSGEGQALTVTEQGRPVGIVTRADLLESLAS